MDWNNNKRQTIQVIISTVGKSGQGRDTGRVAVLSFWEDNIWGPSEGGEEASQADTWGKITDPAFSVIIVEFN